jgi:hypothetical protein
MPAPFTSEQISNLSLQIEQQLTELRDEPPALTRTGNEPDKQDIHDRLPVQWRAIAAVTKEEPRSFWRRFKQAAHSDLCDEGGVLNAQWQRYRDLSSKSVLESFGVILAGMGYSGNALHILVVALGVIVLHIGLKAICEEY